MHRSGLLYAAAAVLALAVVFAAGYETGRSSPRAPVPYRDFRGETQGIAPLGAGAEVREVLLNPDPLERTAQLASLLGRLGPESLDDILQAYDTVFLDVGEIDLIVLGGWWARFDPQAAYKWTSMEWRADHPSVAARVLRAWGRSDPEAAMRTAQDVSAPVIRRVSIHAVISGWEESGRPGSFEFVRDMLAGHERQRALLVVARRKVLRDGVEEAFRWAEAMPDADEAFKLNLVRRVASAAAEIEPQAAGAWAKQHFGSRYGAGLPQRVGTRWVKRDPEAALAWLSTLPPSKDRKNGVEETFRTWMRRDKPSAKAWMRAREQLGPWMDSAVSLYAVHLSGFAPEEGMVWAGKISDDELRTAAQTLVARWWLASDEVPAQAYLDGLDRDAFPEIFWKKVYEIPNGLRRRVRQFQELQQREATEGS